MKIVADENIPLIHEFFDSMGEVYTVPPRTLSPKHTRDADILVVRSVVPIGPTLLENSALRFVGTCTAGIDHLDVSCLDRLGIRWSGAPGCNAAAVGDYVFSALAALGVDSLNVRVGIIGCGQVGGGLFRRLTALGVECRCFDPFLSPSAQPGLTGLDEVLESDVICIHAPLTRSGPHPSLHLLGAKQLERLPTGATLISAGRGGVVDNKALLELLESRRDLKVVLDVWESEPEVDRALFDRVTLGTPHIAGHSYDGKAKGTEIIYRKVCELLHRPAEKTYHELDPFPAPEPIRLAPASPLEALRSAVLTAYDMREDHRRFAQALQEGTDPRAAFDRLRRNYPIRREFSNFRVELEEANPQRRLQLAAQLRALGFMLED
ncbi:4-phosphoerythronate dehydrogenase [Gilvimarinus sp. F26214L]|uniref:4-phosphoerythronate dehydrogenase n=1 Tax=Gilvimarinus sp. DZF01 TaxID=3461371 RepID=UPI004045305E